MDGKQHPHFFVLYPLFSALKLYGFYGIVLENENDMFGWVLPWCYVALHHLSQLSHRIPSHRVLYLRWVDLYLYVRMALVLLCYPHQIIKRKRKCIGFPYE